MYNKVQAFSPLARASRFSVLHFTDRLGVISRKEHISVTYINIFTKVHSIMATTQALKNGGAFAFTYGCFDCKIGEKIRVQKNIALFMLVLLPLR